MAPLIPGELEYQK